MANKYNTNISLWWIFMLVATLNIISQSCVEGLRTLDKINYGPKPKGTIKTIKVPEDGDIIDCVDIYKQPAFSDPRIKDLKMKPSSSYLNLFNKTKNPLPKLIQKWHKYGECPEGTIPIRRTWIHNATNHRNIPNDHRTGHEYATAYQSGSTYHGAFAAFNLWNPRVTGHEELSLAQLWIVSGRHSPPMNTIEAGWIVYPDYFDSHSRLFTFWTATGYEKGCYNLECDDTGFVQTNHQIALGSAFEHYSEYNGSASYETHINVVRDWETKDWWLEVQDIRLGFFPHGIFTNMADGADIMVEFGGEIINRNQGNRHTSTQMGSGHLPHEGYRKASYVRNMKVVNDKYDLVDASLTYLVTRPSCYDLIFGPPETIWEEHFYYGGPGYSHQCQ